MPETNTIKKSKKIGEVFNDYKTNSNIVDAEITKMNLIKALFHLQTNRMTNRINIFLLI